MSIQTCENLINTLIRPKFQTLPRIIDTDTAGVTGSDMLVPTLSMSELKKLGHYSGYAIFARLEENHVAGPGNICFAIMHDAASNTYLIECYITESANIPDYIYVSKNVPEHDIVTTVTQMLNKFEEAYA